jgi:hypothetical protein
VQIGDTTSGSTDAIVEPVTKLSFAGQNIHYNFIAVDGADDISTASGIQRGTPPQESVREFRVVNTTFTSDFGRGNAGIVNIITKTGTNEWHGSIYEYFRNNALDAKSILQAPGLNILRQNQFGASLGGPFQKDKTFIFANYEGQRRGESPFYNSAVLNNINAINNVKVNVFHLPPEPAGLNVLRMGDIDNGFIRVDQNLGRKNYLFTRYFIVDGRLTNQSPLNDGFDLPSAFKNNFFRDQSLVSDLTTTFSSSITNELRGQFARRSFDFPTVTTQPHLEVTTFTVGTNRGNPDFYREHRFELVDNVTWSHGKHTVTFGGNFNFVRTDYSFPIFIPFEADFGSLDAFLGTGAFASTGPAPFVTFFMRFQAPNFTEPTYNTSIFLGSRYSQAIRQQAFTSLDHTYNGFFIQDKWRTTNRLTLNAGLRYEFETWPSNLLSPHRDNFDPRVGLAYNLGTKRNIVVRAGFGLFHGIILTTTLFPQTSCCGGIFGKYPGHAFEDEANAPVRIFAFGSSPPINAFELSQILAGTYPDATKISPFTGTTTGPCIPVSTCGLFGDAVIVRYNKNFDTPYGVQASLGVEFEPLADTSVGFTYLRVKGVHLGNFFNINQPDPSGQVLVHNSAGASGCKNVYYSNPGLLIPGTPCSSYPNLNTAPLQPGVRCILPFTPACPTTYGVFFEADSFWNSVFDGLLVNVNKRLTHHYAYGISYTFSKTIDDGPNPSFVLIPQDSQNIRAERAISADDVRHRFVGNVTVTSPTQGNALLRDWQSGLILTLQSPQHFTKFAGSDVNGDVFGVNDRVGIENRDTFKGDTLQTLDLRISRAFPFREKIRMEFIAEAFNLLNKVNIRFFNTAYGAADFCPDPKNPSRASAGPNVCGTGPFFKEGSPNPLYGTPRAVFNPRQLQFALRFTL